MFKCRNGSPSSHSYSACTAVASHLFFSSAQLCRVPGAMSPGADTSAEGSFVLLCMEGSAIMALLCLWARCCFRGAGTTPGAGGQHRDGSELIWQQTGITQNSSKRTRNKGGFWRKFEGDSNFPSLQSCSHLITLVGLDHWLLNMELHVRWPTCLFSTFWEHIQSGCDNGVIVLIWREHQLPGRIKSVLARNEDSVVSAASLTHSLGGADKDHRSIES